LKLTRLIFTVFFLLAGILVFAIWSNAYVYAQQQLSSPPAAGSSNSSLSKRISLELKAKMCDPSNPSLKVVNTTEARVCGIPKTVKPPLLSATPQTSAVSSSTQQTTTKPASVAAPPKQQQITTTNNNTNAISQSTVVAKGATIVPVSHPTNTSLSSSPPAIAPQVKAVNQQKQMLRPITAINGTAGQNHTFAATSPVVSSDEPLYLGYHGNGGSKDKDSPDRKPHTHHSTRSISDGGPKEKSSNSDTKPSTPHIRITATDNNGSTAKKTSSAKVDVTPTNDDSSPKDKSGPSTELSNDHVRSSTPADNSFTGKKKTNGVTKVDRTDSTNGDSSQNDNDDSTDTKPSLHLSTRSTYDSSPKDKVSPDTKPPTPNISTNDDSSPKENDDSSDTASSSHPGYGSESSLSSTIKSVIKNNLGSIIKNSIDDNDKGGDSFFGGDKFFSDNDDF
jgi:hypothetical protein